MQVIKDFLEKNNIKEKSFVLGVSGGADSLAMALMFKEAFPSYNLVALTVDHKLRQTSTEEANYVSKIMQEYGIEHHVLTWHHEETTTAIEEKARNARYKLMCDWAKVHNISCLVIAHHLLDQAETFLMRLHRGSGLYGLSAMSEISERDGISILRPFLHQHPDEMKKFLRDRNITWIEDESNQCKDFLRVRLRQFLTVLEKETGITPEKIVYATDNLRKTRSFIEDYVENLIDEEIHCWDNLAYSIDYNKFLRLHTEIKFRLIAKLISNLNQNIYIPESESLENIIKDIENESFQTATLGSCYIERCELRLYFIKEYRENSMEYKKDDWDKFVCENPKVRGIKLPHKLKIAYLKENL